MKNIKNSKIKLKLQNLKVSVNCSQVSIYIPSTIYTFICMYVSIYLSIYLSIHLSIVIKEKTKNIFKMKIFQLLPLSIHSLSLCKFCFQSNIKLNSYRARYKVVQSTNRTRFNFYNKVW